MNRRQLLRAAPLVAIGALLGKDEHMSWASDDLASVMIAPQREFAGWGQGIIKAWNPDTFENVIDYRGAEHHNIPVASGVEALTYQPGDVVMLSRWQPTGGGAVTLRIGAGGRVIVPGTGAAEKAVAFMRTTLAEEISAEVFANRITDAFVEDFDQTTEAVDFIDLDPPGPQATVEVSPVGKMQVTVGCFMNCLNNGGYMGFEVRSDSPTGPVVVEPDRQRSFHSSIAGTGVNHTAEADRTVTVTGLAAGRYVVTAKYVTVTSAGAPVGFRNRVLSVTTF